MCPGLVEHFRPGSGGRFFGFWSVTFLENFFRFFGRHFKNITFQDLSIGVLFEKISIFDLTTLVQWVGWGVAGAGVVGSNPLVCFEFLLARGWGERMGKRF